MHFFPRDSNSGRMRQEVIQYDLEDKQRRAKGGLKAQLH